MIKPKQVVHTLTPELTGIRIIFDKLSVVNTILSYNIVERDDSNRIVGTVIPKSVTIHNSTIEKILNDAIDSQLKADGF